MSHVPPTSSSPHAEPELYKPCLLLKRVPLAAFPGLPIGYAGIQGEKGEQAVAFRNCSQTHNDSPQ